MRGFSRIVPVLLSLVSKDILKDSFKSFSIGSSRNSFRISQAFFSGSYIQSFKRSFLFIFSWKWKYILRNFFRYSTTHLSSNATRENSEIDQGVFSRNLSKKIKKKTSRYLQRFCQVYFRNSVRKSSGFFQRRLQSFFQGFFQ